MPGKEEEHPYQKKIAALGGGTGLPTLLEGLIKYNRNDYITAIPGTWDSGGSSGQLRWRWGIFPEGDVRRCHWALTDEDQKEVLAYLWEKRIGGKHPLGNLIFAELERAFGGHIQGVNAARTLFKVEGKIAPISTNRLTLITKFEGGVEEFGEHQLDERWKIPEFDPTLPPSSVYFATRAKPNPEALKALAEADIIIISMGSLIGSILPHFQVPRVSETIINSNAILVDVLNLMTEKGQTDALKKASDNLKYILRSLGSHNRINYMIVNDNQIDPEILEIYERERQYEVKVDYEECQRLAPSLKIIPVRVAQYIKEDHLLRHDPDVLAKTILELP